MLVAILGALGNQKRDRYENIENDKTLHTTPTAATGRVEL
jgi:hypothetical protein